MARTGKASFFANVGPEFHPRQVPRSWPRLAADAGRGPIPVTVYGVAPQAEVINSYIEAGVEAGIFWLPSVSEEEALPMLDQYSQVMETVATAGA